MYLMCLAHKYYSHQRTVSTRSRTELVLQDVPRGTTSIFASHEIIMMLSKVVSESGWALAVGAATKADQQRSHKSGRRNVFVFRNGVVKDISSQRSCPDGIFSRVKKFLQKCRKNYNIYSVSFMASSNCSRCRWDRVGIIVPKCMFRNNTYYNVGLKF